MQGFNIAEDGHVVNIIPPVDANTAAISSDRWTMKGWQRCQVILQLGVTGAACDIVLNKCTAATSGTATAIAFSVYKEETAAGDTLGARTAVAATGFSTSTNDNVMYVIDIDANDLDDSNAWLEVTVTDPGAATLISGVAILSGAMSAGYTTATAIA